jgi:hypothetical protein
VVAFEGWLLAQDFNSDQMRLLRLVQSQIEANPEMADFNLYRFTQPPFSFNGGVQRARQLFGGNDALHAMLAALNAAVFSGQGDAPEAGQPTASRPIN